MEPIARTIVRHPGRVFVAFALLTCFFAFQLLHLRVDFTPQATFNKRDPEYKLYESFVEAFGSDDTILVLLVRGEKLFSPAGLALLQELTGRLEALDELKQVRSLANLPEIRHTGGDGFSVFPFTDPPPENPAEFRELRSRALRNPLYQRLYISPDGTTTAVTVELMEGMDRIDEIRAVVEKVEAIAEEVGGGAERFEILPGGIPFVRVDMVRLLLRDQMKFMPMCGFMLILVSYLIFRSARAVAMLLGTVFFITVWAMGILSLCGGELDVLTSTLPTLVMIIGVADSIHLMGRYEEEIRRGHARKEAVYRAVRQIGGACFFTTLTTAMAFASLGVSSNAMLSHFGIFSSLAVVSAYGVTLSFLPLLLLRWGTLSVPGERETGSRDRLGRVLDRCANLCIRRPGVLFLAGLAVFFVSLLGAFRTGMSNDLFEFYREDSPVVRSNRAIEESLAGVIPYSVTFQGDPGLFKDPEFLEKMWRVQRRIEEEPLVRKSLSLADLIREMKWAFHGEASERELPSSREAVAQLLLLYSLSGNQDELDRLVDDDYARGNIDVRTRSTDSGEMGAHIRRAREILREEFPEGSEHRGHPLQSHITGVGVFAFKTLDNLMRDMIRSIFMACGIIFLVIAVEFRSLRIALMSSIPNLIPVLFTYGSLGWLGIQLELSTVVVFTISLGIAVDDSIHFLVRFREEFAAHGDRERAIRSAFRGAGRAIAYTTVILVLGLGVLGFSSLPPTVRFAALTAATLLSALLADLFVLPACIMLFRPGRGGS